MHTFFRPLSCIIGVKWRVRMLEIITGTENKYFDGGCYCGAVRFLLIGPLTPLLICHCDDCRRISGTSWAATSVPDHCFKITSSSAALRWYDSSSWAKRGFCTSCGSSMFYRMHGEGRTSIAPGALDDNDMLTVRGQIFAISHPLWGVPNPAVPHLDDFYKP